MIATDRGSETAEGERDGIIQVTDVNERPVLETVLSNTTLVVDDDPTEIPHLGTVNDFPGGDGGDKIASRGDVQFNSCDDTNLIYDHLVHELGHALGIGGGNTGKDSVEKAHPNRTIIDITMAYDAVHDCSPQPLDVMAIYALYQTVDSR